MGFGVPVPLRFTHRRGFLPEALKLANDTTYGLAAAVFTQNINRAHRVAHKLKAGTAWVCYTSSVISRRF